MFLELKVTVGYDTNENEYILMNVYIDENLVILVKRAGCRNRS